MGDCLPCNAKKAANSGPQRWRVVSPDGRTTDYLNQAQAERAAAAVPGSSVVKV